MRRLSHCDFVKGCSGIPFTSSPFAFQKKMHPVVVIVMMIMGLLSSLIYRRCKETSWRTDRIYGIFKWTEKRLKALMPLLHVARGMSVLCLVYPISSISYPISVILHLTEWTRMLCIIHSSEHEHIIFARRLFFASISKSYWVSSIC